jgi:hypothetical protein
LGALNAVAIGYSVTKLAAAPAGKISASASPVSPAA